MMSPRNILLPCCLVFLLSGLVGCGNDDEHDAVTPPSSQTDLPQALEDYWQAQEDVSGSLDDLDTIWTEVEDAIGDPQIPSTEIDGLVDEYLAAATTAGDQFAALIALENAIVPYGSAKGYFTSDAKSTVTAVYAKSREIATGSGQMLRTCWRVLGGSMSLRAALLADDAGVPVISDVTEALQDHLADRDALVGQAILTGEDHAGLVPLESLAGETPEEQAATYAGLADDDPLKLQIRGAVHRWDAAERTATLQTLLFVAQGRLRHFTGVVTGSPVLGEIATYLATEGQDPADRGGMLQTLQDIATAAPLSGSATVIMSKRDQTPGHEKIAVLQGVQATTSLDLPVGTYDVVVVADGYIRAIAPAVTVTDGGGQSLHLDLYDYPSHPIILEDLSADRATVGANETAHLHTVAVSTTGRSLQFTWQAEGPGEVTLFGRSPDQNFIAEEPGTYTVSLTASDGAGHEQTTTLAIEVLAAAVRVSTIEVRGGFDDGDLNPGEQADIALTVQASPASGIVGVVSFSALGRAEVIAAASEEWTFPAGGRTTWPVTVALPTDYSEDEAAFLFTFTTAGAVIEQELHLPVEFWARIAAMPARVDDRVLAVTGQVSNPALSLAHLIVNNDIDQVYEVHLDQGNFDQVIILEGADEPQAMSLSLVAEAGSRRAEDTAHFTADFVPAGLRVTLYWDTNGTDVDLWVTDPFGEKCYYAHKTTASGLALDVDDVTGYGPENITCVSPPAGDYLVQVHYFSDHDGSQAIPSNCDVVIRLNESTPDEQVYHYTATLNDTGDLWTVATVALAGKSQGAADGGAIGHLDSRELPAK